MRYPIIDEAEKYVAHFPAMTAEKWVTLCSEFFRLAYAISKEPDKQAAHDLRMVRNGLAASMVVVLGGYEGFDDMMQRLDDASAEAVMETWEAGLHDDEAATLYGLANKLRRLGL